MAEQQLNGTNVGSGFQQMHCERVAHGMRADRFTDAGDMAGLLTDTVDSISGDWLAGDITFEKPLFRSDCPPVVAEDFQQPGREHDVPVFLSLAQFHMNDHPLAVEVVRLQADRFGNPQSGGVTGGQDGAVLQAADAVEKMEELPPD
jgi:hypothetical protein